MTFQEIFNTVWAAITAQGCASKDLATGICVYDGPNKTGCGIGLLLPVEVRAVWDKKIYDEDGYCDGNGVTTIFMKKSSAHKAALAPEWMKNPSADMIHFLASIQDCHDMAASCETNFVPQFQKWMKSVAKEHSLKVPA